MSALQKIAKGSFTIPDFFKDEKAISLMEQLLNIDPAKRGSFE
jgi:hypothetical protein